MNEAREMMADFSPILISGGGNFDIGPRFTPEMYMLRDCRLTERDDPPEQAANYPQGLTKEFTALNEGFDAYLRGIPLNQKYSNHTELYTLWWRWGWRMGRDIHPNRPRTYLETLLASPEYKQELEIIEKQTGKNNKRYLFSDAEIREAVRLSKNHGEAAKMLGREPTQAARVYIRKNIKRLNLDTSHFTNGVKK